MNLMSPSKGKITFEEMMLNITQYINSEANFHYKLVVGSDSQVHSETCLITAIVIHREGKGAKYYYQKKTYRKIESLRQKIFYETALSLEMASLITNYLEENDLADLDMEIHVDVGRKGATRELIKEVVGMVTGNGFVAKIKPDSFGASCVADKYTK